MEEFRVPTKEILATVRLENSQEISATLYTALGPGAVPVPVVDRLNSDSDHYLPLASEGSAWLLNRDHVIWVRLQPDQGQTPGGTGGQARNLRLSLSDGQHLAGTLHFEMPPGRQRLVDYLNSAPRFLAVVEDEGATMLVASRFVTRVDDLGDDD